MTNFTIGIEGLVGAGKTSICRKMLDIIPNTVLVNGGNIYRSIVYAMMQNGEKLEMLKAKGLSLDIKEMMDLFKIEVRLEDKETIVYLDGKKVPEEAIQSKEASMAVSTVAGSADNKKLFIFAKELINTLKKDYNVIVSGRSTMKIYPELDYHFFVVADLDERVRRKCIQYEGKESFEEIKENISRRDELQKQAGFYEYSDITIEVDVTDCKSVEESTKKVMEHIKLPELEV